MCDTGPGNLVSVRDPVSPRPIAHSAVSAPTIPDECFPGPIIISVKTLISLQFVRWIKLLYNTQKRVVKCIAIGLYSVVSQE